ncbi:hypothetical protein EJB05_25980 [Eragrostis curvula]|uniref:Uncharacterized protein n=1 Tax=Eragrostis curvula TaxID=38414 RepID=A0A5J9UJN8_9POAL|nr:hypothetical protein EJB05_25980 [Eragrostis curvula]
MTKSAKKKTAPGASSSNVSSSSAAAAEMKKGLLGEIVEEKGEEGETNAQVQRKAWLPACCYHPLSDKATISFLPKAADTSVMGLVTLIALCATYLLAWGRPGTACIPKLKNITVTEGSEKFTEWVQEPSWMQVIVASLPFAVFPLTLYVSGMVQAAKKDEHALGAVATLCLLEFIAAIVLGGVMTVCVTGSLWWLIAPVLLIVLMVLTWGLTFKYPNWLRSFIWSTCFRHRKTAPVA